MIRNSGKTIMLGSRPDGNELLCRSPYEQFTAIGRNTGNMAFNYAIAKHLDLGPEDIVPWATSAADIDLQASKLVLPCANQLGPHIDMGWLADKIAETSVPCVAIGLGAQSSPDLKDVRAPEGSWRWIQELAARSIDQNPNISVRGAFTQAQLSKRGFGQSTVVLGCPSLLINPRRDLGRIIADRWSKPVRAVAVCAGQYQWGHLARIERSLVGILDQVAGSYICQAPYEMFQMSRNDFDNIGSSDLVAINRYIKPQLSLDAFIRWSQDRSISFVSVPAWMDYYRRFDFVIGLRFHGVALAIQAGIPAICVAHDSRTVEMCQLMQIPYVETKKVPNELHQDDLRKLADFDANKFDACRANIAREYCRFLSQNELSPSSELKDLAGIVG